MSSSARSEAANLVSATSGTERERGFVGIVIFWSDPFYDTYFFKYKSRKSRFLQELYLIEVYTLRIAKLQSF